MKNVVFFEKSILFILFLMMAGMALATQINNTSNINGGFITAIIIFFILFLLTKKKNLSLPLSALVLIVFFMVFLPRLLLVTNINVQPWNDFGRTLAAGEKLANHDVSGIRNNLKYSSFFPDLVPWVVFEAIVAKLFQGNSIVALRILNCIACGIIGISVFLIGSKISRQLGLLSAGIYALWPSSIVFSGVLSCQHFSAACEYFALAFLIYTISKNYSKIKKILIFIFIGCLLGIGQLFRPDALPILLSMIIFLFQFYFKKEKIGPAVKKGLISATLLVLAYFLVVQGGFWLLEKKDVISDSGLRTDMRYKFYVGLNSNNGKYLASDEEEFFNASSDERGYLLKERIHYFLDHPLVFLDLQYRKYDVMWGQNSQSFFWLGQNDINQLQNKFDSSEITKDELEQLMTLKSNKNLFTRIEGGYYSLIILFASIGAFFLIISNSKEQVFSLLTWFSFCYIGVFFFIEVQARYRYLLIPTLIVFAAYGMISLFKRVNIEQYLRI